MHWWGSAVWWTVRMWRVFEPLVAKVFPQKLHRRSSSENSDIPMIKIQRLFEIKIETRSQYDLGNLFSFFCIQNAVSRDMFGHSLSGICESCSCASWGHWHSCNFITRLAKESLSNILMSVSDVCVQGIPSWVLLSTRGASQVADVA